MPARQPRISRTTQAIRFLRVVRLLLWTVWVIYRERRRVVRARQRDDRQVEPNIDVLIRVLTAYRAAALELGVLMIKLGQFLSSRADLLPEQALAVLASLQDEVPAAPYSHVASVIEAELGQPVEALFSSFEREPAGAASLGQVHKAVLASTGETVAVKVQRPNIDRLVAMDLSSIRFVIWVVGRFVNTRDFFDLPAFYREFKRTIEEEIDYVAEAGNAKRFADLFRDRPGIVIPRIHTDLNSKRVLVLEWIDGIKVNDYDGLEVAAVSRVAVAQRTVEAYLYQFFEVGFFHADPHPGNIFVLPCANGHDPKVAFVDFGMVGSLTPTMKQQLKDLFLGFVANNAHGMAEALRRLGFVGEGANMAAIERAIALMMEQYHGITLGQARDLQLSDVAHEIEALLYSQPFRIPAQFAFTGKAVGTLSGVATGLAPEFNLLDVAVPYAQRFLGMSADGSGQAFQEVMSQLIQAGRLLLAMPGTFERVLTKLETGQLEVRVAGTAPRRGRHRPSVSAAGGSASWAVVVLAMLGSGVALSVEHLAAPGWLCLGLAGLTAVVAAFRR